MHIRPSHLVRVEQHLFPLNVCTVASSCFTEECEALNISTNSCSLATARAGNDGNAIRDKRRAQRRVGPHLLGKVECESYLVRLGGLGDDRVVEFYTKCLTFRRESRRIGRVTCSILDALDEGSMRLRRGNPTHSCYQVPVRKLSSIWCL